MKTKAQLLVLSVLLVGSLSATASTFPADAEAVLPLPAAETSMSWGVSAREVTPHEAFPFGGGYLDD